MTTFGESLELRAIPRTRSKKLGLATIRRITWAGERSGADSHLAIAASSLGGLRRMLRRKRVVRRRAAQSDANMHDGRPALKLVMASAVEQIRNPYGCRRSRGFDAGKEWMIIHNRIVQKDLAAAAGGEIERRGVIDRARRAPRTQTTNHSSGPKSDGSCQRDPPTNSATNLAANRKKDAHVPPQAALPMPTEAVAPNKAAE